MELLLTDLRTFYVDNRDASSLLQNKLLSLSFPRELAFRELQEKTKTARPSEIAHVVEEPYLQGNVTRRARCGAAFPQPARLQGTYEDCQLTHIYSDRKLQRCLNFEIHYLVQNVRAQTKYKPVQERRKDFLNSTAVM